VAFWAGLVLSYLPALLLVLDGVLKLVKPSFVVEETVKMGYTESAIVPLGIVVLACTLLYMIPATAVLGAILLTGYLGGAVATHVIHQDGPFTIAAPVIFAVLLWLGLVLRDERLRSLVPWRMR
jgi:hypothetical protein